MSIAGQKDEQGMWATPCTSPPRAASTPVVAVRRVTLRIIPSSHFDVCLKSNCTWWVDRAHDIMPGWRSANGCLDCRRFKRCGGAREDQPSPVSRIMPPGSWQGAERDLMLRAAHEADMCCTAMLVRRRAGRRVKVILPARAWETFRGSL